MHIILLGTMPSAGRELLQQYLNVTCEITTISDVTSADSHLGAFETADVIIGGPITKAAAKRVRNLKLFHAFRGGIDGLGIELLPDDITIANTYHHEQGVAEFVIMAMLTLQRRVCFHDQELRRGQWQASRKLWGLSPQQETLTGKTTIIVGLGRIGTEVAHRAHAFGMRSVAVSRTTDRSVPHIDSIVGYDTWLETIPNADFIVASCRLAPETEGLFDADIFDRMKSSAFFINVARAEVADETAVFQALRSHQIAGAAIDVWWRYPQYPDETCFPSALPFHELPNVLLSPNRASWTHQMLTNRVRDVAENVNRLSAGRPLINVIR